MGWRVEVRAVIHEEEAKVGEPDEGSGVRRTAEVRRPKLTDRDRQLLGYLGLCRYLSTAQVLRLFFPARDKPSSQRRLLRLAAEWGTTRGRDAAGAYANFEPPYLRRLFFRTYEGERVEVWALTDVGYAMAARAFGAPLKIPSDDVGASFLEHAILLNDVFVGLVDPAEVPCSRCGGLRAWSRQEASARRGDFELRCSGRGGRPCPERSSGVFPRVRELPFVWAGPEGTRLPWKAYEKGALRDRVIVPDAVLGLPARRLRLFLEYETGTQTLVGDAERSPGATSAKLERYDNFFAARDHADVRATLYARMYPDGWSPELVFVVGSESRRTSVTEVIQKWKAQPRSINARAMLAAEVVQFARGVGAAVASPAQAGAAEQVEVLRPGRVSVRAEFLLEAASCLRHLAAAPVANDELPLELRRRARLVLKAAEVYAERAKFAAARPVGR